MGAGPIPIPDHPLVTETIDNCLREAMDVDGLDALLDGDRRRRDPHAWPSTRSRRRRCRTRSCNSNPVHLSRRRAARGASRARRRRCGRWIRELAGGLGALDPEAIAEVARQAWPVVRDADELHDVLLSLGVVPLADAGGIGLDDAGRPIWWQARRATWARAGDGSLLVAAERAAAVRLALPAR